ncbi:hypothetical protein NFI96_003442 [Prochilodus magdalenae]|nr:hypothetical protein NFI96_003442 [Prochilodus magdalenae]
MLVFDPNVDECLLAPPVCGSNSTCNNTIGGYSCSCWTGFTNSSLGISVNNSCNDVDECLSAPSFCGLNSTCTNTIGGYSCSCWEGFTATYSDLTVSITNPCIDVDECLLGTSACGPNSTCTNSIGGYTCSCVPGFTATNPTVDIGVNNTCIDVDECLLGTSTCGPNSTCTNSVGGYSCSCVPGFTATNSLLSVSASNPCIDIDECLSKATVCGPNSTCTNSIGGYSCSCVPGFTATNPTVDIGVNNTCIDVDECLLGTSACGPNSTCTNSVGGYSCSCVSGFTATNPTVDIGVNNTCIDVDECLLGTSACGPNSTCTNSVGGYSCSCVSGFTATNSLLSVSASNPCIDIDECLSKATVCGPNSTCTNSIGGYSCSCVPGFTATNPTVDIGVNNTCIDVDECLLGTSACGPNSTCTNSVGGYSCSCVPGFTATNSLLSVSASNPCIDIDECLSKATVCGPNSTCTNSIGGYSCSCVPGFTATNPTVDIGVNNTCIDVNECLLGTSACGPNSTCTNSVGGYSCSCVPGFTATNSLLSVSASNPCIDVNECLATPSPCGSYSTCKNTEGGYSCSCLDGFIVENANQNVSSSNPCKAITTTAQATTTTATAAPTTTVKPTSPAPTKSRSMSLTIDETFDLVLTDPESAKFKKYKSDFEKLIDESYSGVNGYRQNSVTVTRFRSGSVIADFTIETTSDQLNLAAANDQLTNNLNNGGYKVNAIAQSVENDLYKGGPIYPETLVILTCNGAGNTGISWTKDGVPLSTNDKYLIDNSQLTIRRADPTDTGTGCITCNYLIKKEECPNYVATPIEIKCQLSMPALSGFSYSSKTIQIKTIVVQNSKCNAMPFGPGDVDQQRNITCPENMAGYITGTCSKTGEWTVENFCVLRVIQDLKEKSEGFLNTLDTITSGSPKAKDTWNTLNTDSATQNASSELLKSIETIGTRLTDNSFEIVTTNIQLTKTNFTHSFNGTFGKNLTTQINIPETNGFTYITTIVFTQLENVLPVRNASNNGSSPTDVVINGNVATVILNNTVHNISLTFDINQTSLGNPQCVFWNFSLLDGIGAWDSTGCEVKPVVNQSDMYRCECNHTTSFSILMSPFFINNPALEYITYIGVGISMGSLILCLIIEGIIWRTMTRNDTSYMRHVSIVNIALSLLIADICFIIGAAIVKEGEKTPEGPCSAATFFMHFFYLALFFWMLLSALLLLYRTVMVFSGMSRCKMMAIAFAVGYGGPLLIAVITVAATAGRKGYILEENACWLNWIQTKAILAIVIPALTIVVINLLVLIVVLYKMLKRGVGAANQPDEKNALVVIARCVAILTPLFGLTWGFGIGTMVSPALGIHVMFALLNSFQGFFILVFGTLLDSKNQYEDGQLSHIRNKREESSYALEYIVVVEVNVSELILIELLQSSFNLSNIEVDNSTTISALEISTVCLSSSTGYQCRCEDQYFWPCDKCTAYGHCDDITNATCGCINGLPNDGEFCQPITELLRPPSGYSINIDISVSDNLMVTDLKNLVMNFSVPVTVDSGVNITEINITTVCTLNGTEYVCRCEEQYAWSYNTCRAYGMCDDSMDGTCGCIRALPAEELCQRGPPSSYSISIDISVSDNLMVTDLKNLLMNLSFPVTVNSGLNITEINITTVCTLNGAEYVCRCEEQYAWSYNTCRTYGMCDDSMYGTCGCIRALPAEELCQRGPPSDYTLDVEINLPDNLMVTYLKNLLMNLSVPVILDSGLNITEINITTVCTLNGTEYVCQCEEQYAWSYNTCRTYWMCDDSMYGTCGCIRALPAEELCQRGPPSDYTLDVEINLPDNLMVINLKNLLMNLSVPVILDSGLNITEINITTVCTLNGTEYVCRCEEQYAWSYNTCRTYGMCDDSMYGTCGCIRALPAEELCQRGPPSDYTLDVEINLPDNLMVINLKNLLMNLSVPVILDSGLNITEINITTVCTLNGTEYVCRCEEQYAWSYNTCRTYGMCDDSMYGTCGCIRALPAEELCQRGPPSDYTLDVEINLPDNLMVTNLKNLLMNLSVPIIILDSGLNITEINITTVCTLNGTEYVCRCEEQYAWSYNTCRTYGMCDDSMDGTCGCIRALPAEELCQRGECCNDNHTFSAENVVVQELQLILSLQMWMNVDLNHLFVVQTPPAPTQQEDTAALAGRDLLQPTRA